MLAITLEPDIMHTPFNEYIVWCEIRYFYLRGDRYFRVATPWGTQEVYVLPESEYNGPACDLVMAEYLCDVCQMESPNSSRCDCSDEFTVHGYLTSDPETGYIKFVPDSSYLQEIPSPVLKSWHRRFNPNK